MKLDPHGLEATLLCEDADDAVVVVEFSDEVRVSPDEGGERGGRPARRYGSVRIDAAPVSVDTCRAGGDTIVSSSRRWTRSSAIPCPALSL